MTHEKRARDYNRFKHTQMLVVEDVEVCALAISDRLKKYGCQVDYAVSGMEVLDMIKRTNYDIIFMDCLMLNGNGFETTIEIRKKEKDTDKHTTIIAVTTETQKHTKEMCFEVGMDDYLYKPPNAGQILEMLEKWIAE